MLQELASLNLQAIIEDGVIVGVIAQPINNDPCDEWPVAIWNGQACVEVFETWGSYPFANVIDKDSGIVFDIVPEDVIEYVINMRHNVFTIVRAKPI